MKKDKWIWMPHAGHFICGSRCQFRLNTYVGKYIVSTVGEMVNDPKEGAPYEKIGCNRLYETMVFEALKAPEKCCPWRINVSKQVDEEHYNDAITAYTGHKKLCLKWSKRS